jgi:hypothetical protein
VIRRSRARRSLVAGVALAGTVFGTFVVGAAPAAAAPGTLVLSPNGASGTMHFGKPAQSGRVTVQGVKNQQLTISTASGTFADNCALQLTLLKPNGTTLAGPVCAGQSGAVSSAALPSTGFYKARLDSAAGLGGTVTVAATSSGGPASITLGAAALTVTISAPSQNLLLGFSAVAGQHLSATVRNGTLPDCNVSLRFVNSVGTQIGSAVDACAGTDGFVDATLPTTGRFSVQLLHNSTAESGAVAVDLEEIHDLDSTITVGGAAANVAIATPGQNARYAFSGTTGDQVSALLSDSTFTTADCPPAQLSLIRPDGTALAGSAFGCNPSFLDSQTLDQDGTWTLLVDPQGPATGTATLQAFNAQDQTGPIPTDGTAVNVVIDTPGENADFHFFGSLGQQVTAQVTSATFTGCPAFGLRLVRPDGTEVAGSLTSCSDTALLGPQTLDQVGAWEVVVDPQGPTTGSATLQLTLTGDQVRPVTVNGAAVNVNLAAGQNGSYTFSATTGGHISAAVSDSTFAGCPAFTMHLTRPDGSHFGTDVDGCGATAFLDSQALDQTGTWAVAIVQDQGTGGSAKLKVFGFDNETATADLTGKAAKLTLKKPGQNGLQTFAATAGQRISALATSSDLTGCPALALSLVRPDGTTLGAPASTCTSSAFLDAQTLDQSGTWTVLVDPQGDATGTVTVQVYLVVDSLQKLKPRGPIASFTSTVPGENARFTFTGHAGDSRTVTISGSTFAGCPALVVSFVGPNGTLSETSTCTADLVLGPSTLDADATWTVFIDPQGPAHGTLIIKLT